VTIRTYRANPKECDSTYNITAFGYHIGKYPHDDRYIAVSRDVEKAFPDGTEVCLSCHGEDFQILCGEYIVADRMNIRHKKSIDILISNDMNVGIWKNCTIRSKYVRFQFDG
jgi:3D (Asp-Asp-Asp) domain-containing protein